jgi:hypothetical protein
MYSTVESGDSLFVFLFKWISAKPREILNFMLTNSPSFASLNRTASLIREEKKF